MTTAIEFLARKVASARALHAQLAEEARGASVRAAQAWDDAHAAGRELTAAVDALINEPAESGSGHSYTIHADPARPAPSPPLG